MATGQRQRGRAVLAGVLGGVAGTLAMNYAQRLWTLAVDGDPPRSAGGKHDARDWQEREEGANANELAAQAIGTVIAGRPLTYEELTVAAPLAHCAFGAVLGGIYGYCLRGGRPRSVLGSGAVLGGATWLLADEIAMPLLRLSRPTTERAAEKHLQSLATHIVFGTVAAAVRDLTLGNRRPSASRG